MLVSMSHAAAPDGRHLLAEYLGCSRAVLDDPAALELALRGAAEAAGTEVLVAHFHRFAPQGVSGMLIIQESHLSIHTWPELGYAAVDLYTCGGGDPLAADAVLRAGLGAQRAQLVIVQRGPEGPVVHPQSGG